jgi:hypothetical protein
MPVFVVPAPVILGPDAPTRLAAMQILMTSYERPAKQYRLVGGLTAIGLGVATVPIGIAMIERGPTTDIAPVILLGIGVGEVIGGTFVLATPGSYASGYARIDDRIRAGREAGEPAEKTLADAEQIWKTQAGIAHDGRNAVGGILLVIGLVASGFGVGLDVATPAAGLSRSDQDGFATGAFAIGYAAIMSSVRSFVFPTSIEMGWQAYEAGAAGVDRPKAATVVLSGIRPVPVRDGMGMGWGVEF